MGTRNAGKFYIHKPEKRGKNTGRRLLGANVRDEDDSSDLTLQDLLDFLGEQHIDPSKVVLHRGFTAFAKP